LATKAGQAPNYGAFGNVSIILTYPNGTQDYIIETFNFDPNNTDSPQSCTGPFPYGYLGTAQLNETGQYTTQWIFTWVFPKSTNNTGDSFTCTGFGSTEERDIQKTFTVTAADGSFHPIANTPTASTEATFPVRPTGTVYVSAASLQRRSARRLIGSGAIAAVALLFA